MEIAITKMSSKGQVVIPAEMRKDIREGEKMMIVRNNNQIIIKRASDFEKNLREDLVFAKRTEEALKKYKKGGFKEMSTDNFLKELKEW